MSPDPYVVNVSSIKDFMSCRYRWWAKWVLNRVPREDSLPLTFGKLLHTIFEEHLTSGLSMDKVIFRHRSQWVDDAQDTKDEVNRSVAIDAIESLDILTEPMCLWQDMYPVQTLEVEQPFEVASPDDPSIHFRGRPDRMGLLWGKLFHVQTKSLNASTNFGVFCELAERSMHEHIYAYAMQQKYPQYEYGGTLMNLVRKLKYRGVPTKKNPEGKILHDVSEILWQNPLSLPQDRVEEMVWLATQWAKEMRQVEETYREKGETPLPNENMNGGWYGNRPDPYFYVLQGQRSLDDDRYFKPREDMYTTQEAV